MGRDLVRKAERERGYYRRAADLSEEELAARRAKQTQYMREYIARDRESYNAKRSEYGKRRSKELRDQVLAALGDHCVHCGYGDPRVLQIDHIDGGGRAHRAKQGGYHYFRTVLDRLDEFQLLCANCHMLKSYRS